jgi:hypothetical protein
MGFRASRLADVFLILGLASPSLEPRALRQQNADGVRSRTALSLFPRAGSFRSCHSIYPQSALRAQ